mmetsp:Transcript_47818/g.144619  ORF Transcript_47818/g.144619 Transcript_47818/m.144619 type:complete len:214 (+) Transcript_47818:338-979(+)
MVQRCPHFRPACLHRCHRSRRKQNILSTWPLRCTEENRMGGNSMTCQPFLNSTLSREQQCSLHIRMHPKWAGVSRMFFELGRLQQCTMTRKPRLNASPRTMLNSVYGCTEAGINSVMVSSLRSSAGLVSHQALRVICMQFLTRQKASCLPLRLFLSSRHPASSSLLCLMQTMTTSMTSTPRHPLWASSARHALRPFASHLTCSSVRRQLMPMS